ncbi:MAG TPA: Ig-like domain-containing protein [Planctomycetota bacterium]|nr:Ig-like domain-containing protein [Planctomycetota bacterium]
MRIRILALLSLLLAIASVKAEDVPALFRVNYTQGVASRCAPSVGDKRVRTAPLNATSLPIQTKEGGTRLLLNLFDDAVFTAVITSVQTIEAGRSVWRGTVEGFPDSLVQLALCNDAMAGLIEIPGRGVFSIHYHGNGQQVIAEIDRSQFLRPKVLDHKANLASTRAVAPRANSQIDVMIVYTAAAMNGAGGLNGINSVIDLAISDANTVFSNSQINATLNLVHRGQLSYNETGKSETDLTRLAEKNDGFMDDVHALRDQHGADVVCLLVDSLSDACGIAYVMTNPSPSFEEAAFSVVDRTCVKNHTYIHELGHNLGCAHDKANSGGQGAFSYAYGHNFIAEGTRYGTVMSYPGEKIPYFSNPNLSFRGVPIGVADQADNARAINNTVSILAGFRASKGGGNAAPSVSITAPVDNASFAAPASVQISANASDSDGTITKVEFFQGTAKVGESTAAPYTATLNNLPGGNYRLTAAATDNAGAVTVSAAVNILVSAPAGPPNDAFANRTAINGFPTGVTGTLVDATKEPNEPRHAAVDGGRSVWWKWTAPANGWVNLSARGKTFEPALAVYTGTALDALTEVGSNNGQLFSLYAQTRIVAFEAVAGTEYIIAVDTRDGNSGEVEVLVLSHDAFRPRNDDFAGRVLVSGATATAYGSTQNASPQTGEPNHAGLSPKSSIWYSWSAPSNGLVTITTAGSNFDTVLAVYTGSAVNALTEISSNDDESTNVLSSRVTFSATSGTVYQIVVDGYLVAEGGGRDVQLNLTQAGATPPNDAFASRIVLQGFSTEAAGSNVGSTAEAGEPAHFANANGNSVWWSWTAPANGTATINTYGSPFDTILAVYTGTAVNGLSLVVNNDDFDANTLNSEVTFTAVSGTTYQIAVDSTGTNFAFGNIRMALALAPAAAPGNDNFGSAFTLTGSSASALAYNNSATAETGEPAHAQVTASKSVWWSWTAPASGRVVLKTEGSTFDTVLAVYTGSAVNALTAVSSNDDASSTTFTSLVYFAATSGQTYYIALDGYDGDTGGISLSLQLSSPPTVTIATSSSGIEGGTANPLFTISRTGDTSNPLVVRYSFGGGAINGTDFTALPLTATIPAGSASVAVEPLVIDDTDIEGTESLSISLLEDAAYVLGTVSSAANSVTDDDDMSHISIAATDAVAGPGDKGTFTITRTQSSKRSYTLKLSIGGTAVNGTDYTTISDTIDLPAGTDTATFDIVTPAGAPFKGDITVDIGVISGSLFVLEKASDRVTITQSFQITSGPTATPNPAKKGEAVSFSCAASAPDATYSWDFGDGTLAATGATPTHTFAAAGLYTVTVTASHAGTGLSAQASLQLPVGGFGSIVAGTVVPVSITKKQLKLNFKTGSDTLNITFTSFKDFGYLDKFAFYEATNGAGVKLLIGNTVTDSGSFQLGKTSDAQGTFRWYYKKGEIRYARRGDSLAQLVAKYGAEDKDVLVATPVTIPLSLSIEGVLYSADATFSYKARQGKSGSGK